MSFSTDDWQQTLSYLQELRQKYLHPYNLREALRIEALCNKIEKILAYQRQLKEKSKS